MRAKKAKLLRKQARAISDKPTEYVIGSPPEYHMFQDGSLVKTKRGEPTELKLGCFRGVYKEKKDGY